MNESAIFRTRPPRPVRRRFSLVPCLLIFFLVPHFMIGLGNIGEFLDDLNMAQHGHYQTVQIVKVTPHRLKSGQMNYEAHCKGQMPDGREFEDRFWTYTNVSVGPSQRWVWKAHTADSPAAARERATSSFSFALIWNVAVWAVLAVVAWQALPYLRQRRLLIHGEAFPGRISECKTIAQGRGGVGYQVHYQFQVSGRTETGQMDVRKDFYDRASPDAPVIILADRTEPGRNVLYEACQFEVVGAGPIFPHPPVPTL